MPSLSVVRASNASYTPSYTPVFLVTGATSGIGQAIVESFARNLHGRGHFIIVGRNQEAANKIIASLPQPVESNSGNAESSDYTYEFVRCDFTLMKNVHELAADLSKRLPKLNFLIHCAGVMDFGARKDTEEGIEEKLAVRYYHKFPLTYDLIPLLRKAKALGEEARVLAVLGAGQGNVEIDLNDLGLKRNYGVVRVYTQGTIYNDIALAEFARRYPDICWSYTSPGLVYTNNFTSEKPFWKTLLWFLRPFILLITTTKEDCAEWMIYAMMDSQPGEGLRRYSERANDLGLIGFTKKPGSLKALWDHSVEATKTSIRPGEECL